MFGITNVNIETLTSQTVLVSLAVIALLAVAYFLYRRTNPPISSIPRYVLLSLRVLALCALALALFETVVGYGREYERKPQLALIIDRSQSMEKQEGALSRKARLDSLLSSPAFSELSKQASVSTFYFSGKLSDDQTDLEFDRTSVGDALEELRTRELGAASDYWMLLSDGRSNSGRDPLALTSALRTPVISVNLSEKGESVDVGIDKINYNPVVYTGKQTEVKVVLSAQRMAARSLTVELVDNKEVLATKQVQLTQEDGRAEISLSYTPREPGSTILRVRVPEQSGEENNANNQSSFSVNVLKSKLQVLMLSQHPDYEFGFLRHELSKSDKYDVTVQVPSGKAGNLGGAFPRTAAEWNRYDLVILHDIPTNALTSYESFLQSYLGERGGSIWWMMGASFASSLTENWARQLLPFYPTQASMPIYGEVQGEPVEGNLFHPAVRLGDDQANIRERWNELPPFKMIVNCDSVRSDATLLLTASQTAQPLMGFRRMGAGKLFVTAAQPFWNWGFLQAGYGEETDSYNRFVEGSISWLTTREDLEPVRIAPERNVYKRGEAVRFAGTAFDLGFRPMSGVSGTVGIQKEGETSPREQDLLPAGEGLYASEFANLPPGRYQFTAKFQKDGQLLKQTQGTLEVEAFSLEEQDMGDGVGTLQGIASKTGGSYYFWQDFDKAVASVQSGPIVERSNAEIPIWNNRWLLILFVSLLSLEWGLRKAKGLL